MNRSFFGKRPVSMVNNKERWSREKVLVLFVLIVTLILIAFTYTKNEYLFSDEVQWARLSYSLGGTEWSKQVPENDCFWIKGELYVPENYKDLNGLFFGVAGSYDIYWDNLKIGANGNREIPGTIFYQQSLNPELLTVGKHQVKLDIYSKRYISKDKIFAGIILGNISKFMTRPLFQLTGISLLIGLLLILWSSFQTRKKHKDAQWMLLTIITFLSVNYLRTFYNYPYNWHELRLILYGTITILLPVSLFNHFLQSSNLPKKKTILVGFCGGLLAIFFMSNNFDGARYYILLIGSITSFFPLLFTPDGLRRWIYFAALLYIVAIIFFVENGLLMALGYAFIILVCYFETDSIGEVKATIKKKITYLVASYQGIKKLIALADIVAIKGANNYSEIILESNKRYLCDKSLGSIMAELPDQFIRIHKSYLIDFNRVENIKSKQSGGKMITLKNKMELPVGRKFVKEINGRLL